MMSTAPELWMGGNLLPLGLGYATFTLNIRCNDYSNIPREHADKTTLSGSPINVNLSVHNSTDIFIYLSMLAINA